MHGSPTALDRGLISLPRRTPGCSCRGHHRAPTICRRPADRRTRPADEGPWPGVVMLHEAWGIDDVLRRHADRLAGCGYLVYAPDLLGEGSWLRCISSTFQGVPGASGQAVRADRVMSPASCEPTLTALAGWESSAFAWAAGFALLLSGEGYDAASVNYGMVPADIDELAETRRARSWPATAARTGRSGACLRLREALRAHGVPHDVEVYPGGRPLLPERQAERPVACARRGRWSSWPMRDPSRSSAADAWRRIEDFFAEHLDRGTSRATVAWSRPVSRTLQP